MTRTIRPFAVCLLLAATAHAALAATPAVGSIEGRINEWNPARYGHSIGRWEQDTLVIDSVGFNEITPGYSIHSEQLHVVERITRPAKDKLVIEITAEDPEAWTAPYHALIEAGLVTGDEIHEWVCAENNRSDHFGNLWRGRTEK
jgi:hypothetical protein